MPSDLLCAQRRESDIRARIGAGRGSCGTSGSPGALVVGAVASSRTLSLPPQEKQAKATTQVAIAQLNRGIGAASQPTTRDLTMTRLR